MSDSTADPNCLLTASNTAFGEGNQVTDVITTLRDGLQVYHASEADLPDIVAIYNQSIASKTATADLVPVSIDRRKPWFDAHVNAPNRPIYTVKNSEGEMIAWGSFSNLYDRPAYHISSEISIYVSQEHQGQGLAAELITWMLSEAPILGINKVVALIFAHNERSLKLFKRMGFEQWGYMPQVCDMDGFIADVVMLGKSLAQKEV